MSFRLIAVHAERAVGKIERMVFNYTTQWMCVRLHLTLTHKTQHNTTLLK